MHLPAGIDLSAYRIVQEALTNVVKHAGATPPPRSSSATRPRALELDVIDDGRGAADERATAPATDLIGMRERVALYGGTLEAGARDGGGYAVRARLPFGDAT